MINAVHHLGLRLATGAFRTSPVLSLYVESDMWSLEHQRKFSALLYAVKVASLPQHPCNALLSDHTTANLFLKRPSLAQPFSFTARSEASELGIFFTDTQKTIFTDFIAPWKLLPVSCD